MEAPKFNLEYKAPIIKPGYWTIGGLTHPFTNKNHNKFCLADKLSSPKTQDEHPEYRKKVEEIRSFLQESFGNVLITLTRIRNNPEGLDTVIHNYGMPDQY